MATITINLSTQGQLKPDQKALAEAISRVMMTDEQTQNAIQDLNLHPTPEHYLSAATTAVMTFIALRIEDFRIGDR
jgi:hypothetical protein